MKVDKTDKILKKEIFSLNKHVPRRRKTLNELLVEERPHVIDGAGNRHRFKRNELKYLNSILSGNECSRLKLPIYIEIESETSGAIISGVIERKIVSIILDKELLDGEMFIYRPEMQILRRKLPTTTQYMFLVK
jgi:hypothetical protein